jgi:hypothetical protein
MCLLVMIQLVTNCIQANSHPPLFLLQIWNLSNRRGDVSLSREDFYIAMYLVSMGQNGLQVSKDAFLEATHSRRQLPLPHFAGVPLPVPAAGVCTGVVVVVVVVPLIEVRRQLYSPGGVYALRCQWVRVHSFC